MSFTSNKLAAALGALQTDVTAIADAELKATVSGLLNLVETLSAEYEALRKENQQLNDEINRLKGEQGKPDIKGNAQKNQRITRPKKNVKRAMTTTNTKRNVNAPQNDPR